MRLRLAYKRCSLDACLTLVPRSCLPAPPADGQDYNLGTADASAGVSASRSTTVTSNSTTAAADGVVSGYSNTLGACVIVCGRGCMCGGAYTKPTAVPPFLLPQMRHHHPGTSPPPLQSNRAHLKLTCTAATAAAAGDFVVIQYNTNGMGQSGGGGAAGQSLPSALLALTSAVGAVLMGALLL